METPWNEEDIAVFNYLTQLLFERKRVELAVADISDTGAWTYLIYWNDSSGRDRTIRQHQYYATPSTDSSVDLTNKDIAQEWAEYMIVEHGF